MTRRVGALFAIGLLRSAGMVAAAVVLLTLAEALSMMNQVRRET
jgi:hypothetical protein